MYQRCQILHRLIKVQSEEQSEGDAGSGSPREENEEWVTSEFITPLLLMVLQNSACDATQRSPFTHSCCLGRTWMIMLAHSNVFSLHLSPAGSLIFLFLRGSCCVYGTGCATWWFMRFISQYGRWRVGSHTSIETPNDWYTQKSSVVACYTKKVY